MKAVAIAIAAFGLTATAADAASITQSVQFGPGPTDFSNTTGTTTGSGVNSQLAYFNAALGTLNSITFSYTYSFNSNITVSASSASSGTVRSTSALQFSSNSSAITNVLFNRVDTAGSASAGAQVLNPVAFNLSGNQSFYNLSAGQSQNYSSTGSGSNTVTTTQAGDLGAFTVGGNQFYTPLASTLTGLVITSTGGNANATQTTNATGTLQIVYNYTAAAPEPASWLLMIGGFGAVGGTLRRRGRGRGTRALA